jgi:hypothetical protein
MLEVVMSVMIQQRVKDSLGFPEEGTQLFISSTELHGISGKECT